MVQVLLVEPCDMVRQVNQLALRAWGTSVCAVKTEDEAISRLKLRGELHLACVAAACSAVEVDCGGVSLLLRTRVGLCQSQGHAKIAFY